MNTKRRKLWIFAVLLFGIAVAAFLPLVEHLPHPKTVTVQVEGELHIPLKLKVVWYDLGLNTNFFSQTVEFDALGRAEVPDLGVRAPLWRIGLKRVLSPFGVWTECMHCYGPWVDCSLRLKEGFRPPDNMRLAQNQVEEGQRLLIKVSLIPDETKFETRDFQPQNSSNLLAEARELIAKGSAPNILRSSFGPELSVINPVRVECRDSALILWMGGKIGYAIVPGSSSCPALNMTWASGTEYPHIFKLEKMEGHIGQSGPTSGSLPVAH